MRRRPTFGGFCPDTFRFLRELAADNRREWMEGQRDRYHFAVREPLLELCRTLAARYVEPVLRGVHGWDVDAEARSGHALTSICKNAYGRSQPYNTTLWIAFCPHGPAVAATPSYSSGSTRRAFATAYASAAKPRTPAGASAPISRSTAICFIAHCTTAAPWPVVVSAGPMAPTPCTIAGPDDLRDWAEGKSFEIACELPPDAPLLTGDALVGEILLTFDRLLPAYACAVEDDPLPFLASRAGADCGHRYNRSRLPPRHLPARRLAATGARPPRSETATHPARRTGHG